MRASQYIELMKHAIGYTPDSRHDLYETLNDAGRALYAMHDWGFRTTAMQISLTADQSYIELPRNFGSLVEAYMEPDSTFSSVRLCSLSEIVRMRESGAGSSAGGILYAFFPSYEGQVFTDDEGRPRVEIAPTPTASEVKVVRGFYHREWTEIECDDEYALPDVPPKFRRLLKSLARAFAWALENQADPHEDKDVLQEFARLVTDEGRGVRRSSVMSGGAERFMTGRYSDQRTLGSVTT